MVDLSARAEGHEYMDVAGSVGPDLQQCLRELVRVNRLFGGVRGTLAACEDLLGNPSGRDLSVLDLGTGAADIPAALVQWAQRRGIEIRVTAVDFNPAIVSWAKEQVAHVKQIEVQQQDVFALPFAAASFDLVHAGLFLHHFNAEQAVALLQIMHRLCRRGLIVNDLHRHLLAYGGIRFFDALFSNSRMAQHDGPQSVLRGFRAEELRVLGQRAGLEFDVRWHWAFRWVATAVK